MPCLVSCGGVRLAGPVQVGQGSCLDLDSSRGSLFFRAHLSSTPYLKYHTSRADGDPAPVRRSRSRRAMHKQIAAKRSVQESRRDHKSTGEEGSEELRLTSGPERDARHTVCKWDCRYEVRMSSVKREVCISRSIDCKLKTAEGQSQTARMSKLGPGCGIQGPGSNLSPPCPT